MSSGQTMTGQKGAESFRFAYKGGFKVDDTNTPDFLDSPLTGEELSNWHNLVSKRDYNEWLLFRTLFGIFFITNLVFLAPEFSLVLAKLGTDSALLDLCLSFSIGLLFAIWLSYFIAAVVVGRYIPVGVTIEGITYLSNLTDVEPITKEEMLIIDSGEFSKVGYQYYLKVSRIGRPLARFEANMLFEIGKGL